MRKLVLIMGLTLLMVFSTNSISFAKITINTTKANEGIVTVLSDTKLTKKIKVRIAKDSKMVTYDFTKVNEEVPYALTFGSGKYDIMIYENVQDKSYSQVQKQTVKANIKDENKVYLNKTEEVNWNEEQRYIKLAKELTKDAQTDEEKVIILYNYLTNNFTYDFTKIYRVSGSYRPDLETLYDEKTGICYDYSAIFAGMLRSLGIPTKLVKGYAKADLNTYHAWNEVLVNGEWKTVDTTNDAYKIQKGAKVDMFKLASDFNVSYEY